MTKILLILFVILLVALWFRHLAQKRLAAERKDAEAQAGARPAVEDMVRCQVCGVNLPRSEALMSQGRFYCCDEHRRIG